MPYINETKPEVGNEENEIGSNQDQARQTEEIESKSVTSMLSVYATMPKSPATTLLQNMEARRITRSMSKELQQSPKNLMLRKARSLNRSSSLSLKMSLSSSPLQTFIRATPLSAYPSIHVSNRSVESTGTILDSQIMIPPPVLCDPVQELLPPFLTPVHDVQQQQELLLEDGKAVDQSDKQEIVQGKESHINAEFLTLFDTPLQFHKEGQEDRKSTISNIFGVLFESNDPTQNNQVQEQETSKSSTFKLSLSTLQDKQDEDIDDPNYHKSVSQTSHSMISSAAMRQMVEDIETRHRKNMKDLAESLTDKYTERNNKNKKELLEMLALQRKEHDDQLVSQISDRIQQISRVSQDDKQFSSTSHHISSSGNTNQQQIFETQLTPSLQYPSQVELP